MTKPKQLPSLKRLEELLEYNPETGALRWRQSRSCMKAGSTAGRLLASGHRQIGIDGQLYRAHRIAWKLWTGKEPPTILDHEIGGGDENWFDNLREATRSQNRANSRTRSKKSKLPKGVCKSGARFTAQIRIDKKLHHLGTFDTPELAHDAYLDAARKAFGQFANGGY